MRAGPSKELLESISDMIMQRVAMQLPDDIRGVYADGMTTGAARHRCHDTGEICAG